MKIWVIVFLVILLPSVYAVEISIPELFTVEQDISSESNKEVYYYSGTNLVASFDDQLKYQYQNRLNSDGESKTLPFGQPILTENRFSFTGKEFDGELHYFNARYYDSELGRFISVDPLLETPYQYVKNNPMNLIDPTGMASGTPKSEVYKGIIYYTLESEYREISDPLRNTMRRMFDSSTLPKDLFKEYSVPPDTLRIIFTDAGKAMGASFEVNGGYKTYANELLLDWEAFSWVAEDSTSQYGPTLPGLTTTIHEFSHFLEHPASALEGDEFSDIRGMMSTGRFSIPVGGVAQFVERMEAYYQEVLNGEIRAYDLELGFIDFMFENNLISEKEKQAMLHESNTNRELELKMINSEKESVVKQLSQLE